MQLRTIQHSQREHTMRIVLAKLYDKDLVTIYIIQPSALTMIYYDK